MIVTVTVETDDVKTARFEVETDEDGADEILEAISDLFEDAEVDDGES